MYTTQFSKNLPPKIGWPHPKRLLTNASQRLFLGTPGWKRNLQSINESIRFCPAFLLPFFKIKRCRSVGRRVNIDSRGLAGQRRRWGEKLGRATSAERNGTQLLTQRHLVSAFQRENDTQTLEGPSVCVCDDKIHNDENRWNENFGPLWIFLRGQSGETKSLKNWNNGI